MPDNLFSSSGYDRGHPLEVLIVDDDAIVLRLLSTGLRIYGAKIRCASSGAEAIEVYREHHSTIDVVLADVQMPVIDGPEMVAEMWAIDSKLRIIFMTGDSGKYSTEDLLECGATDVLHKPFHGLAVVMQSLREAHEGALLELMSALVPLNPT